MLSGKLSLPGNSETTCAHQRRLNDLTVAHRVHILEPQWNPSVESQAIGRVVRLGQMRPVQVIRYVVRSTIERVGVISISTDKYLIFLLERPEPSTEKDSIIQGRLQPGVKSKRA